MLTGGKLYGEGVYGCVFARPGLKCKDGQAAASATVATKLMDKTEAVEEMTIANRIRKIPLWQNYYIVATDSCVPARIQPRGTGIADCDLVDKIDYKDMRILKMAFGGTTLSSYKFNFHRHSFLSFCKNILEGAALMTLFGIVHRDLHLGNVLVDDEAVPRIIDFGLAIDTTKKQTPADLLHTSETVRLLQIPPDYTLVNSIAQGWAPYDMINHIMKNKKLLQIISTTLGVPLASMDASLREFYEKSPSAQSGDIVGWFERYWSKLDSWAVGAQITYMLSSMMLWDSFMRGEFSTYSDKLLGVLRGMCAVNPMRRLDCVAALAELDPGNYIIAKWGRAWLAKLG